MPDPMPMRCRPHADDPMPCHGGAVMARAGALKLPKIYPSAFKLDKITTLEAARQALVHHKNYPTDL